MTGQSLAVWGRQPGKASVAAAVDDLQTLADADPYGRLMRLAAADEDRAIACAARLLFAFLQREPQRVPALLAAKTDRAGAPVVVLEWDAVDRVLQRAERHGDLPGPVTAAAAVLRGHCIAIAVLEPVFDIAVRRPYTVEHLTYFPSVTVHWQGLAAVRLSAGGDVEPVQIPPAAALPACADPTCDG